MVCCLSQWIVDWLNRPMERPLIRTNPIYYRLHATNSILSSDLKWKLIKYYSQVCVFVHDLYPPHSVLHPHTSKFTFQMWMKHFGHPNVSLNSALHQFFLAKLNEHTQLRYELHKLNCSFKVPEKGTQKCTPPNKICLLKIVPPGNTSTTNLIIENQSVSAMIW